MYKMTRLLSSFEVSLFSWEGVLKYTIFFSSIFPPCSSFLIYLYVVIGVTIFINTKSYVTLYKLRNNLHKTADPVSSAIENCLDSSQTLKMKEYCLESLLFFENFRLHLALPLRFATVINMHISPIVLGTRYPYRFPSFAQEVVDIFNYSNRKRHTYRFRTQLNWIFLQ